jgi:hypothetical protein
VTWPGAYGYLLISPTPITTPIQKKVDWPTQGEAKYGSSARDFNQLTKYPSQAHIHHGIALTKPRPSFQGHHVPKAVLTQQPAVLVELCRINFMAPAGCLAGQNSATRVSIGYSQLPKSADRCHYPLPDRIDKRGDTAAAAVCAVQPLSQHKAQQRQSWSLSGPG